MLCDTGNDEAASVQTSLLRMPAAVPLEIVVEKGGIHALLVGSNWLSLSVTS